MVQEDENPEEFKNSAVSLLTHITPRFLHYAKLHRRRTILMKVNIVVNRVRPWRDRNLSGEPSIHMEVWQLQYIVGLE